MTTTKKKTAQSANMASEKIQDSFEKATKNMGEMGNFSKQNYEACVSSATVLAKGVEEITAEGTTYAKEAMDTGIETIKTAATLRNPQELMELNTKAFQSAFEANMAQMTKMSEMFIETAKEASEPLNKRYSAMVDMVQAYRA